MSDERIIDIEGHTQLLASRLAGVRVVDDYGLLWRVEVLSGGDWAPVGPWLRTSDAATKSRDLAARILRAMVGSTGGLTVSDEFTVKGPSGREYLVRGGTDPETWPVTCPACFRPRTAAAVSGDIRADGEGSTRVVCPCGHVYREVEHTVEQRLPMMGEHAECPGCHGDLDLMGRWVVPVNKPAFVTCKCGEVITAGSWGGQESSTQSDGRAAFRCPDLASVPPERLAFVCCHCGAVFAVDVERKQEGVDMLYSHRSAPCEGDDDANHCLEQADAIKAHNEAAIGQTTPA